MSCLYGKRSPISVAAVSYRNLLQHVPSYEHQFVLKLISIHQPLPLFQLFSCIGRVWELRLPIDHLWKYLPSELQKSKDASRQQDQVGTVVYHVLRLRIKVFLLKMRSTKFRVACYGQLRILNNLIFFFSCDLAVDNYFGKSAS